jgi:hypothetical protein
MDSPSALRIVKVLRAALQCVEESGIASPESDELDHLKQQVVLAVSELELQKKSPEVPPEPERPALPGEPEAPIVVLRMR